MIPRRVQSWLVSPSLKVLAVVTAAVLSAPSLALRIRSRPVRLFSVREMEELDAVYSTMAAELRSRYRLLYQCSVTNGDREFR